MFVFEFLVIICQLRYSAVDCQLLSALKYFISYLIFKSQKNLKRCLY